MHVHGLSGASQGKFWPKCSENIRESLCSRISQFCSRTCERTCLRAPTRARSEFTEPEDLSVWAQHSCQVTKSHTICEVWNGLCICGLPVRLPWQRNLDNRHLESRWVLLSTFLLIRYRCRVCGYRLSLFTEFVATCLLSCNLSAWLASRPSTCTINHGL